MSNSSTSRSRRRAQKSATYDILDTPTSLRKLEEVPVSVFWLSPTEELVLERHELARAHALSMKIDSHPRPLIGTFRQIRAWEKSGWSQCLKEIVRDKHRSSQARIIWDLISPEVRQIPSNPLYKTLGIPLDAHEASLIACTDAIEVALPLWGVTDYDEFKKLRSNAFETFCASNKVAASVEKTRKPTSIGLICERQDCGCMSVGGKTRVIFKRCSGCKQVNYCSVEVSPAAYSHEKAINNLLFLQCQRLDWPKHKSFCRQIDPNEAHKDGISRLWPLIEGNGLLMSFLVQYLRSMVDLEQDVREGTIHQVSFCFTMYGDDVVKPGGTPRYIPQLQQVMILPLPMFPALRRESKQRLAHGLVPMLIGFFADGSVHDTKGGHTRIVYTTTHDLRQLSRVPEPVAALIAFNLVIRQDVDDVFGLRLATNCLPFRESLSLSEDV